MPSSPLVPAALALAVLLAACGGAEPSAPAPDENAGATPAAPAALADPAAPGADPAAAPAAQASADPAAGAPATPGAAVTSTPAAAASSAPATSAVPPTAAPARSVAAGPPASFATCSVCHAVQEGRNLVGPHLAGVVGRRAGSVAGANYSPALRESGLVWTEANLDRYLADPAAVVPGGIMPAPGLTAAQRREVIDYLASL